jgi:prostaglandin reductase 1
VIDSKSASIPVGCYVLANVGWRSLTVVASDERGHFGPIMQRMPDLGDLPVSLGLGILGMPGSVKVLLFLNCFRRKRKSAI